MSLPKGVAEGPIREASADYLRIFGNRPWNCRAVYSSVAVDRFLYRRARVFCEEQSRGRKKASGTPEIRGGVARLARAARHFTQVESDRLHCDCAVDRDIRVFHPFAVAAHIIGANGCRAGDLSRHSTGA